MQILAALKVTIRIEVNSESLAVKYPIAQTISSQTELQMGSKMKAPTCGSEFRGMWNQGRLQHGSELCILIFPCFFKFKHH